MARLEPVGSSVAGKTRRFCKLPHGRYLYGCPSCCHLVSHDQAFCDYCDLDLYPVAGMYYERE